MPTEKTTLLSKALISVKAKEGDPVWKLLPEDVASDVLKFLSAQDAENALRSFEAEESYDVDMLERRTFSSFTKGQLCEMETEAIRNAIHLAFPDAVTHEIVMQRCYPRLAAIFLCSPLISLRYGVDGLICEKVASDFRWEITRSFLSRVIEYMMNISVPFLASAILPVTFLILFFSLNRTLWFCKATEGRHACYYGEFHCGENLKPINISFKKFATICAAHESVYCPRGSFLHSEWNSRDAANWINWRASDHDVPSVACSLFNQVGLLIGFCLSLPLIGVPVLINYFDRVSPRSISIKLHPPIPPELKINIKAISDFFSRAEGKTKIEVVTPDASAQNLAS